MTGPDNCPRCGGKVHKGGLVPGGGGQEGECRKCGSWLFQNGGPWRPMTQRKAQGRRLPA